MDAYDHSNRDISTAGSEGAESVPAAPIRRLPVEPLRCCAGQRTASSDAKCRPFHDGNVKHETSRCEHCPEALSYRPPIAAQSLTWIKLTNACTAILRPCIRAPFQHHSSKRHEGFS
jgi:hypothetical protein